MKKEQPKTPFIEAAIAAIGSIESLVFHTAFFVVAFLLSLFKLVDWQIMLLVLTTVVSLEAIYMAIFIQIAVNRNTAQLREVEEDIDEIQEDIDEIQEDVDEIQEDVEEMSEEEVAEAKIKEEKKALTEAALLEQLTNDVQRLLRDLEALKKPK